MELYTDLYYVHRIQAGEVDCFACLLDRYSRQVHALIRKMVNNREDAEELTQDVFMKVYKHLSSFKGDSSFSTWIYRIAYNTAVSETRRKKQEFLALEEEQITNVSEEQVSLWLGHIDQSEQIERLEKALTLLPSEERAIILLFYLQDKPIDEIAGITGLTNANIKTKLHRIRKKLFVLLNDLKENEI